MLYFFKRNIRLSTIRRKLVLLLLFPPLLVLIWIFRIVPIRWIRSFADFVGAWFFRLATKSRTWALANLEKVYGGELSESEREDMAKACFVEVIKSFFDYMAYSLLRNPKRYFRLVEVVGEEHLRNAYNKGGGVICLIPHLSSWEFAAITPPMLGYETSAASKSMKMSLLEKLIVTFRRRRGMKNISREGSYQKLIEVLNNGECLVLMTDQDTRVKGIFADFLGFPAYTPLGASRLLAETNAALVPMVVVRKADDNYRFIIFPEIPTIRSGDNEKDLIANTINQNNFYSEIIRKYPSQWVWMHRRWKTTPETLAATLKARAEAKQKK